MLKAAKESGVAKVVITSSISAIIPSPSWPADVTKDENCWTDLDYCEGKEAFTLFLVNLVIILCDQMIDFDIFRQLWYPTSKVLAERAAWEFAKENDLEVVVINPGTVMGQVLPPQLNASMAMLVRLLQGQEYSSSNLLL